MVLLIFLSLSLVNCMWRVHFLCVDMTVNGGALKVSLVYIYEGMDRKRFWGGNENSQYRPIFVTHNFILFFHFHQRTLFADFSIKYFFHQKNKCQMFFACQDMTITNEREKNFFCVKFRFHQNNWIYVPFYFQHGTYPLFANCEENEKCFYVCWTTKNIYAYTTWLNRFFCSNLQQMKSHVVIVLFALWCVKREWINLLLFVRECECECVRLSMCKNSMKYDQSNLYNFVGVSLLPDTFTH